MKLNRSQLLRILVPLSIMMAVVGVPYLWRCWEVSKDNPFIYKLAGRGHNQFLLKPVVEPFVHFHLFEIIDDGSTNTHCIHLWQQSIPFHGFVDSADEHVFMTELRDEVNKPFCQREYSIETQVHWRKYGRGY